MSELGGNEEGVGGRADSLNFFEVILSSLRENHLGGKKIFFFLSLPTHTCDVVCVGGRIFYRSHTGKSWGVFFGQEVTLRSWGNWKPLEK